MVYLQFDFNYVCLLHWIYNEHNYSINLKSLIRYFIYNNNLYFIGVVRTMVMVYQQFEFCHWLVFVSH